MKWFCLDSIRRIERLLIGSNQMIVIYDPQGTIKQPELLDNIYICYELQQLSSLHNTPCLLILAAAPEQGIILHEETCIVSLVKLKKAFFNQFHHYHWQGTAVSDDTCTFKWVKQRKAGDIFQKLTTAFGSNLQECDVHIYRKKQLYLHQQLEDICFDGYFVLISASNVDIHLEFQKRKFAYVKFAWNYREQIALYEEIEAIRRCSTLLLSYVVQPEVMKHTQQMLVLTDPKPQDIDPETIHFNKIHLEALKEIYYQTQDTVVFESSYMFREISISISQITSQEVDQAEKVLVAEVQQQLVALLMHMDEKTKIEVAQAHNNFTPQHVFVQQERLFIHEWSNVKDGYPILYDVFQYIFYHNAAIGNKPYDELKQYLQTLQNTAWMQDFLNDNKVDFFFYLKLYLLFQVSERLKRYTQRPHIHAVPKQLLQVWNEALTDVLAKDLATTSI